MKYIKQSKRGQSLVEVIVACGILGIVMTAIMSITVASKNLLYRSEDQTKATTLAQQGIEIVKHQRDIGCSFSNIKNSNGTLKNTMFVINGDTNSSDDETLHPLGTPPGSPYYINKFPGFQRQVYIYELKDVIADDSADVGVSGFQSGAACGSIDTDYDCTNRYYLIKVEVKKGSMILNTKTIMSK